MLTRIQPQDAKPGDILCLRTDKLVEKFAPLDSWRIIGEAISLGEGLVKPQPKYVHIAFVFAVGTTPTIIQESGDKGCEESTTILDDRWDAYRINWRNGNDIVLFLALLQSKLHTQYGWNEILEIGAIRVLHLPMQAPTADAQNICSVLGAQALYEMGYNCWPKLKPTQVMPSDYPGLLMKSVLLKQGE